MMRLKRVYAAPAAVDGCRILVDRLWPRGLSKSKAKVDLWLKEIAPSDGLRRWYSHDPKKWKEFRKRYFAELKENRAQVELLREEVRQGIVTLVYGAKDDEHNNAAALRDYLGR